jgi:anti-sigma regulatory factor (Ser/Thr protein kinase)
VHIERAKVDWWVVDARDLPVVRSSVRAFALAAGDVVDDLVLATSELVTNALVHAGGPCHVAAMRTSSLFRLAVTDTDPAPLRLAAAPAGPLATSGRGLAIMAAIASRWGVVNADAGKTVWFEVDIATP